MKRIMLIIVLLITSPIYSSDSNKNFISVGALNDSCQRYVNSMKNRNDQELYDFLIYTGAISGFLTAVNWVTPNTYDILGQTDIRDVLDLMKKHCTKKPQDSISSALVVLAQELYPNRKQKAP